MYLFKSFNIFAELLECICLTAGDAREVQRDKFESYTRRCQISFELDTFSQISFKVCFVPEPCWDNLNSEEQNFLIRIMIVKIKTLL